MQLPLKIVLLINIPLIGFSQQIKLQGIVLDSLTKEVIPYSTIEFPNKGGTVCNHLGQFEFWIDNIQINSDLEIRNLGYETKRIKASKLLNKDTIHLKNQIYSITPLEIIERRENRFEEVGIIANKADASYGMSSWMQVGLYFDNPNGAKKILKSISYYIPISKKKKTPFRVRIYGVNSNGEPGEDLLKKNIVTAAKQDGWLKVNLEEEMILLPENGFFIVMEWINAGKEYIYKERVGNQIIEYYGQKLGSKINQTTPKTWMKLIGQNWKLDDREIGSGKYGYRNVMIKAELEQNE